MSRLSSQSRKNRQNYSCIRFDPRAGPISQEGSRLFGSCYGCNTCSKQPANQVGILWSHCLCESNWHQRTISDGCSDHYGLSYGNYAYWLDYFKLEYTATEAQQLQGSGYYECHPVTYDGHKLDADRQCLSISVKQIARHVKSSYCVKSIWWQGFLLLLPIAAELLTLIKIAGFSFQHQVGQVKVPLVGNWISFHFRYLYSKLMSSEKFKCLLGRAWISLKFLIFGANIYGKIDYKPRVKLKLSTSRTT